MPRVVELPAEEFLARVDDAIAETTLDDLVAHAGATKLPFGRHKGRTIAEAEKKDPGYLSAVLDLHTRMNPGVRRDIETYLQPTRPRRYFPEPPARQKGRPQVARPVGGTPAGDDPVMARRQREAETWSPAQPDPAYFGSEPEAVPPAEPASCALEAAWSCASQETRQQFCARNRSALLGFLAQPGPDSADGARAARDKRPRRRAPQSSAPKR
jgi:hypothetical protein